jgi:hypothetical protein
MNKVRTKTDHGTFQMFKEALFIIRQLAVIQILEPGAGIWHDVAYVFLSPRNIKIGLNYDIMYGVALNRCRVNFDSSTPRLKRTEALHPPA